MKLLKTLNKLKIQFLTKLPGNDVYAKSLASLSLLALLSFLVWFISPYISYQDIQPFVQPEKRFYLITFIFLLWLLKFLLFDLDGPNPLQYKDPETRKKLQILQTRFQGAIRFLKKTTLARQDTLIRLSDLPWYLCIGPKDAGKTSLLAHSNVNFILQKQFAGDEQAINGHCDWWMTRDTCIVDIPAAYFAKVETNKEAAPTSAPPPLWHFFLRLIKRYRAKESIQGIIIALPLSSILKNSESKHFSALSRELCQRLHEAGQIFSKRLPCYLVLTKCDLLPGFSEFFAETTHEEIAQAWGVTLPNMEQEKSQELVLDRLNALIKKLNQQLLWRLHQERNPFVRPLIKDFPLQMERMKGLLLEFLKKFNEKRLNISIQGIYFTSALQEENQSQNFIDEFNATQRSITLFKEPSPKSRPYFIKQVLLQGLQPLHTISFPVLSFATWKKRFAYALAIGIIVLTGVFLGKDFEQGVNQAYSIQNHLSNYHIAAQKNQNALDHIVLATNLLDTLQNLSTKNTFQLDFSHLLSFYSHQSQEKAHFVYKEALRSILLPELKNLMEDYLKNPVNKSTEYVYAVLKAYLMLGDPRLFQAEFILNTTQEILPSSLNSAQADRLKHHLELALQNSNDIVPLNGNLIGQTRKYLNAMPSFQLAYVILKNINSNNSENEINLGTKQNKNHIFITNNTSNLVPIMFTSKAFTSIFSREITVAAQEALTGNWILGETLSGHGNSSDEITLLTDQLRNAYLGHYIDVWENLLAGIQLAPAKDLKHLDAMLQILTSNESPLLQLLHTLHENTFFEPVVSNSPKLQEMSLLLSKNKASVDQLYLIFSGMQGVHQYIQKILHARNQKKAAFEAMSYHMLNRGKPDALAELRIIAEKSPEPIKLWLNKIANQAWHFLMQDAGHYLDTSWQTRVVHYYENDIANHYPFDLNAKKEVSLEKFAHFFGNPGIVTTFYKNYLNPFIDSNNNEWRWKNGVDNKIPFSNETLRQFQQAMAIHRAFFPNGDDKLYIQFALQPYQFGKKIKSVKVNINDKHIRDERANATTPHVISWPNTGKQRKSSIELTFTNRKTMTRDFAGDWGWFKLVNQSFDSAVTKKQMVINLSLNDQAVKYLLFTESQNNPFLSLNMKSFYLPTKLLDL